MQAPQRTNLTEAPIKHADMTAPNTADLEAKYNGGERLFSSDEPDDSCRHLGMPLSAEAKALVAAESSFDLMQRVMKQATDAGVQLYHTTRVYKKVAVPDEDDCYRVEGTDKLRFLTMEEHVRVLSHKSGSVAADAVNTLTTIYRDGWAAAVHRKYGAETDSQRARREAAAAGTTALRTWHDQTHIYNGYVGDKDIDLQLSIPELRWLRSNQVQREAALSQVRWAIHCLFWCAYEARKVNVTVDWASDPEGLEAPINISIDCQQQWDDAVAAMHLYMRMLTRFVDANERKLVIKAVIWEIYHCTHHKPVEEYLGYLADTTEDDSKLNDFLHAYNTAEVLGIKDKAKYAWAKCRAFFLGGGSIRGLASQHALSLYAISNFTAWWLKWAQRAKARAEVDTVLEDIPDDMRDHLAEKYNVGSWDELEDWQRQAETISWAKGQLDYKEWLATMAQAKRNEIARAAELSSKSVLDCGRRAMAAFPKPADIEAMAEEQYVMINPDHKKKLDKAEAKKAARRSAGGGPSAARAAKARAQPPAKKRRVERPVESSDEEELEDASSSDDEDDSKPVPKGTTRFVDSSDEEAEYDELQG